jgi:hypothetical protein
MEILKLFILANSTTDTLQAVFLKALPTDANRTVM